ncbi:hypothetical protein [Phenylobacterium sp.]|jgi:hypothetical protein|uniref:hypothetical protein n=1 Tax=Phenylobacterium sp. TaxID=1871053 RepID=UPI002F426AAA
MLEILIWICAAGVVALGCISFQIALMAPEAEKSAVKLIGLLTFIGCLGMAIFIVHAADQQATAMPTLPGFP